MAKAVVTAANQWSEWEEIRGPGFDVSVSGTFAATVTLQRKRKSEADALARSVNTWTAPAEASGVSSGDWLYRIGVAAGQFTSGSIAVEVSI